MKSRRQAGKIRCGERERIALQREELQARQAAEKEERDRRYRAEEEDRKARQEEREMMMAFMKFMVEALAKKK